MKPRDLFVTRREMLSRCGMGMGAVALTSRSATRLLAGGTGQPAINPLAPKKPPLPAKAKRVLHLFMNGGASHVDTFDPKPSLAKFAGKPIPITLKTERRTGAAFPSPFTFQKFGQSGTEVSEIFSNVGGCVDDLCIVRSMHTDIPEPRAVADDDELRRRAPGSAQLRLVGHLRARLGESESARLHRALSGRSADAGKSELAFRVSTGRLPGDTHRHARDADRQADREHPQQLHDVGRAAPATRSAGGAESRLPGAAPERRAAGSARPIVRAGLSHADGSRRRLRPVEENPSTFRRCTARACRRGR